VSGCSGELLSALVDGALGHEERDRVHAHLAGCDRCRAEVEAQRRLKARLSGLAGATPPPSEQLLRSLQGLAVPGVEPALRRGPVAPPSRVRPGRPVGADRPAPGPGRRGRLRRTSSVVGGTLVVAGVGAALFLGGSARTASTPVDPGSDAFVVDFVSTTNEVPLADPAGAVASLPRR
jgi:anti-sigma factor RsiW